MTTEQKNTILATFRKLSLAAFEIGRKAGLLHEALEDVYRQLEDAD